MFVLLRCSAIVKALFTINMVGALLAFMSLLRSIMRMVSPHGVMISRS